MRTTNRCAAFLFSIGALFLAFGARSAHRPEDVGSRLSTTVGLDLTMSKASYTTGDTITATEFRIRNTGTSAMSVEIKSWLEMPGVAPISILNLGSDGSFSLPGGTNQNIGPVSLLTVATSTTRGTYEFSSRVLDPTTGELLHEDINTFSVGSGAASKVDDAAPISFGNSPVNDLRSLAEIYRNSASGKNPAWSLVQFSTISTTFLPSFLITLSKSSYTDGESVSATEFRMKNAGTASGKVEMKAWLFIPNASPISILNLGGDGSITLPGSLDANLGPVTLLNISSNSARGNYEAGARSLDPITGALYSVDLNPFTVTSELLHPKLYSDTSPFNQRIASDAEIDPRSSTLIQSIIEEATSKAFLISLREWTVPAYYATADTPRYDVRLTATWAPASAVSNVPIPGNAAPDPEEDGHMVILDLVARCEYDLWEAKYENGRWSASWGNAISMDGDGIYPKGYSARGSGFALLAGLIWPDELRAGQIQHALIFSYSLAKSGGPVAPATESDGESTRADAIPEGARVQLDPTLNLDTLGLTPVERVVARALQEYGMFLADVGGGVSLYAVHPMSARVDPYIGLFAQEEMADGDKLKDAFVLLKKIPVDRFRVLRLGPQIPDPELRLVSNACVLWK